jgi:DGQHR domain-containing protein
MADSAQILKRRALRLIQSPGHPLYLFTLTGAELLEIGEISRVSRDEGGQLIGYQRPEVKRHIQNIVDYLNGENILFPNSIILALSSRVRFHQSRGPSVDDGLASAGTLEIPLPNGRQKKPAWIVDGQQRAVALSKCNNPNLIIPINAFVADDIELQRDQFLRVNSAKPLPHGLITELLPEVSTSLPANLSARRMPSAICEWLNSEKSSPFFGLIRRASTSEGQKTKTVITDTSVIKMIEESLTSPAGCLFPYRNIATGETDFDGICKVLVTYWTAVSQVFPEAWGKPPSSSRLMHGAGIRAIGRIMDRVMPSIRLHHDNAVALAAAEIRRIAPLCRWTEGKWEDLGGVSWNEIQNVPRHIRLLSNLLIRAYLEAKGNS